jgi:outer membrane lipoprotein carrier protein
MTGRPGTRLSGALAVSTLGLAALVLVLGLAIQVARGDATPAPLDVDAVLERMKHAYDGRPGVRASFVQTNTGMSYFEPLVMKGTLALKKPRRIRMEYLTPRAKTYLSDGTTLWIVDEADRTVTRSRNQVEAVGRLFDFLTGSADVRKDFIITPAKGTETREGLEVLRLKPKSADAGVSMVFVRVHPKTGLVHAVVTVTPFGDRSETVLSDVRTDVDLPDAGFVYTDRDGFTIVDID